MLAHDGFSGLLGFGGFMEKFLVGLDDGLRVRLALVVVVKQAAVSMACAGLGMLRAVSLDQRLEAPG